MQGFPCSDFLLSLAQRKKQRNIHLLQGLPLYGEDATENRRNRRFSGVLVGSQAFVPSGFARFPTSPLTPPLGKGLMGHKSFNVH